MMHTKSLLTWLVTFPPVKPCLKMVNYLMFDSVPAFIVFIENIVIYNLDLLSTNHTGDLKFSHHFFQAWGSYWGYLGFVLD